MAGLELAGPVIPAARTLADLRHALAAAHSPTVILLCGDLMELPGLLADSSRQGKNLVVHIDLMEGIGKDRVGVRFLARMGVRTVITTRSQIARYARDEGMAVIQRLFLMDSEALRTGLRMVKNFRPDAIEVLPASVPGHAVREVTRQTGLPVLAGGLAATPQDVAGALANGVTAVSTSRRELWNLNFDRLPRAGD